MSFSKTSWKLPYTVLTYIILMNLLIAMMADTFSSVASNAEAEYQMQFARIVKEQVETTVLCVPLNVPEYIINWVAGDRGRGPDSSRSGNALQWGTPLSPSDRSTLARLKCTSLAGRHYTWPSSQLPFQLKMSMVKVRVREETEKARVKAQA